MSPLLLSIWYPADRFEFANTCSMITQNDVFVLAALINSSPRILRAQLSPVVNWEWDISAVLVSLSQTLGPNGDKFVTTLAWRLP